LSKRKFSPYPTRAIGDGKLSVIHFRALGAIALHDALSNSRLDGKLGAGCYAGLDTLAKECGVNYANLSVAIGQLREWGYVEQEQSDDDKRRRVYRVIYDTLPVGKPSPDVHPAETLPVGKLPSTSDTLPAGEASQEVVCPPNPETQQSQQHDSDNIFPERERYYAKRQDSSLRAPLRGDGLRIGSGGNDGGYLATIERSLKETNTRLGPVDQKHVKDIFERTKREDPVHHQAERILEEYGGQL
jgi:DNA-binding MarR family transcriptional regulator